MKHLVTSKDNVTFVVESADQRSAGYDRMFAAQKFAQQLDQHGDFTRAQNLDELVPGYFGDVSVTIVPRIASPAERRAAFTVIKGSKK